MTPMPYNPIIVLRVTSHGEVIANQNNIGNDLRIVVVTDDKTYQEESAGIPYSGKVE
jgi:hypothetical protein